MRNPADPWGVLVSMRQPHHRLAARRSRSRDATQPFYPGLADIVAHHVTLASGSTDDLPTPTAGEVVGHVDDGAGLQALVVAIQGTTDRPDGSTYHITWSLDRSAGREPRQSNDVLRDRGWTRLDIPIPILLKPSDLG